MRVRVWRALRYVYSVERNRKVFKRLFPPDLFAAFIDIGHYASDLEHYQVSEWSCRNAQLMAQGRGLSTSRYTIWSCGLFEGKGVSTSRVSPTRSSLSLTQQGGAGRHTHRLGVRQRHAGRRVDAPEQNLRYADAPLRAG